MNEVFKYTDTYLTGNTLTIEPESTSLNELDFICICIDSAGRLFPINIPYNEVIKIRNTIDLIIRDYDIKKGFVLNYD